MRARQTSRAVMCNVEEVGSEGEGGGGGVGGGRTEAAARVNVMPVSFVHKDSTSQH